MKYGKNDFLYVLSRWMLLFAALLAAAGVSLFRFRTVAFTNAKSTAENIMLNAANQAVINVLRDSDVKYDDISHVSVNSDGIITGITIDTAKVNMLKGLISNEIYRIVTEQQEITMNIPLGTLLNQEYTSGYGPKIKFKMNLAHTEFLDFDSKLTSAGINSVLHQIVIKIDITGNILAAGASKGFKVSTTALAAQTLINGTVPDSYINVIEGEDASIVDDIFNYGDVN